MEEEEADKEDASRAGSRPEDEEDAEEEEAADGAAESQQNDGVVGGGGPEAKSEVEAPEAKAPKAAAQEAKAKAGSSEGRENANIESVTATPKAGQVTSAFDKFDASQCQPPFGQKSQNLANTHAGFPAAASSTSFSLGWQMSLHDPAPSHSLFSMNPFGLDQDNDEVAAADLPDHVSDNDAEAAEGSGGPHTKSGSEGHRHAGTQPAVLPKASAPAKKGRAKGKAAATGTPGARQRSVEGGEAHCYQVLLRLWSGHR